MNVKTNLAFVHLDKSEGKQFEASLPNTNIAYYLCILLFLLAPHLTSYNHLLPTITLHQLHIRAEQQHVQVSKTTLLMARNAIPATPARLRGRI
ncbi:hypothetical protein ACRRAT_19510 [Enterobacter hormaechei]|uniref:hypothetical protein n=1 Tax=Enterobacter hormaechei TaxID=158836 RepID=UPI0011789358|nr:hypothetical protein [Enterobacter hormaechei]MDT8100830.1 hypothetical protein [Enterobacter hormaechei]MDT8254039.1 hypothetical protein [Enterobacter hormaechei]MDY7179845.1 hypothetical protein [Enterobacter hormaechei]MDY7634408.1 hypothetical protein [Enterobacter hormaechei]